MKPGEQKAILAIAAAFAGGAIDEREHAEVRRVARSLAGDSGRRPCRRADARVSGTP